MLQSEFQERVNFTVTEECYHSYIEPEYNASKLDKDEWCKQWKEDYGIQRVYTWMANQMILLQKQNENLAQFKTLYEEQNKIAKSMSDENKRLSEELARYKSDENILAYKLADIAEKYSASELREEVIGMIGETAYISYKLKNNKTLWKVDKELIINLLNNNDK